MVYSLGEIAEHSGLELRGDAQLRVVGVCSLANGAPDRLGYLSDTSYASELSNTKAGAVIITAEAAQDYVGSALIARDPKLAYVSAAALFLPPAPAPGIHANAVVDDSAQIDASASIGACAVIAANVCIGPGVVVAPGCVIEQGANIGGYTRIGANASIGPGVQCGEHDTIAPNVVIGARGFGLAHDGAAWQPIPQLGSVRLGNHVEVGAGSTIDCGAIEDTIIEDGVKIDDQVHIAHNCRIGAHTVIAGCTGIAGSCHIGSNCVIGGGVGIGDHVTIVDQVMITGASQVPKDISKPGVYSSTLRVMPAGEWRKRLAIFRKLDRIQDGLRALQRRPK